MGACSKKATSKIDGELGEQCNICTMLILSPIDFGRYMLVTRLFFGLFSQKPSSYIQQPLGLITGEIHAETSEGRPICTRYVNSPLEIERSFPPTDRFRL